MVAEEKLYRVVRVVGWEKRVPVVRAVGHVGKDLIGDSCRIQKRKENG